MNAISVWNTVYMEKAVEELKGKGEFREDLMPYIWPLGWEHIVRRFIRRWISDKNRKGSVESL
nr:transposase [Bacillus thuringiensis]